METCLIVEIKLLLREGKSKASKEHPKSKHANIAEFFGKKPLSSLSNITNSSEPSVIVVDSSESIHSLDKNMAGLDVTSKEAKKGTASEPPAKSSVELIKINLKERMEKIGSMAFESKSADEDTEMLESEPNVNKKAWGLENWMFGDLAVIIELFNSIMPCYKAKEKSPKKRVSRRSNRNSQKKAKQAEQNEAKMSDVTLTSIEYESFVQMMNGENKELFVKIIRNLLHVFINCEQIFGVS